ncbi:hypothetical protein BDQ17DRAFT_1322289 [Cyathus striatus]|nr:hypothetical protein BDQ17DRAFT_1322289 [Cyathus striatus]
MPYFENASNFVINQPTFVDNQINNGRDALQQLLQYVARGATHDSRDQYEAPKCHPDTRKQLLSDVNEWIREPDKETGIVYLHGAAGAGKSCIARSVCEEAAQAGLLGASFFFWRGSPDRNNANKLFTTIASQLAMLNEEFAKYIAAEIQQNSRLLYDAPLEHQFIKLILEPYLHLVASGERILEGVIVIDGLDECIDRSTQISVLHLLARAVQHEGFQLGFFITSRPELHLREVWDTEEVVSAMQLISLSNIRGTSQDIRVVLQSGFSRILNDRRFKLALKSVPRPWPSSSSIEKLVERSSGQFIYAATVMKFISSPNHNPNARLEIVLGIRNGDNPLADLDLLYHEILAQVEEPKRIVKVLRYILAIMEIAPHPVNQISEPIALAMNFNQNRLLIVVEQLLSLPQGEAFLALNDLHSLIDLNVGSESHNNYLKIQFYHKSFHDFLITKERSNCFHVDLQAAHADVAQSCPKFLTLLRYETTEQHVSWFYAFFCFREHIYKTGNNAEIQIPEFFQPLTMIFNSATKKYSNHLQFQEAIKILGFRKNQNAQATVDFIEALINNRPLPSMNVLSLLFDFWVRFNDIHQHIDTDPFRASIIFPLWLRHLKSYGKGTRTVNFIKQLLALKVIIPSNFLDNTHLYHMEIIPDPKSFAEIVSDINNLYSAYNYSDLEIFLSTRQFSGIFHCTSDDYADAYTTIIESRYSGDTLHVWSESLLDRNQSATLALLTALESAAQDFREENFLNGQLTHRVEVYLLDWLKVPFTSPVS